MSMRADQQQSDGGVATAWPRVARAALVLLCVWLLPTALAAQGDDFDALFGDYEEEPAESSGDSSGEPQDSETDSADPSERDDASSASEPRSDESVQTVDTIPVDDPQAQRRPADAKPKPARVIEEIVVTATKRAKSVRDIPTSVDAYSGEDLEDRGATGFEDYLKFSPGVSFSPTSPDRANIAIRGVTTDSATNLTSVPTGLFLDEVPLANPSLAVSRPNLDPFDMQSIEVLKGPQGTLFGGSALAGALRAVPNAPDTQAFAGKAFYNLSQVSESADRGEDFGVMLNLPAGDTLAARFVAVRRAWPGVVDDTRRDLRDVDSNAVEQQRGMLSVFPSEALGLQFTYQKIELETDDITFADNPTEFVRDTTPGASPLQSRVEIGGLKAQYDFERFSVISATNSLDKSRLAELDVNRVVGLDTLGDIGRQVTTGFTDTFTQELRLVSTDGAEPLWGWLAGWEWLVGAFYMRSDQAVLTDIAAQFRPDIDLGAVGPVLDPVGGLGGLLDPVGDAIGPQTLLDTEALAVAREIALFADVTGQLTDWLELNVGVRLFDQKNDAQAISRTGGAENLNESGTTEEQGVNPKIALTWHAMDNLRVIASAAKGFRFGGVNAIIGANTDNAPTFYESDELWNYELGVRSDWFDGLLRADVTAFRIDWSRLQITQRASDGLNQFIDNVGGSKNQGVEAAVTSILPWGFTLNVNGAYVDARTVVPFESAQGPIETGTRLPATPYLKWSAALNWGMPLGFADLSAAVSMAHNGSSFNNLAKEVELPAYETVDASVNLVFSRWRTAPKLSLTARNLLDDRSAANIVANAGTDSFTDYYFIRPRVVALQLGMEF